MDRTGELSTVVEVKSRPKHWAEQHVHLQPLPFRDEFMGVILKRTAHTDSVPLQNHLPF